jgi:hypothetical protein
MTRSLAGAALTALDGLVRMGAWPLSFSHDFLYSPLPFLTRHGGDGSPHFATIQG